MVEMLVVVVVAAVVVVVVEIEKEKSRTIPVMNLPLYDSLKNVRDIKNQ
jgi:hypothetical protein